MAQANRVPARLFFYDSISPIVDAHTVDRTIAFRASRYDKSLDGTGDYLNCPFNREPNTTGSIDELHGRGTFESHIPDDVPYFESCLPIEEIARRGQDTLRFGPMKPMGLTDPRTGRCPYAACNCGRRICAPIATTWSASRIICSFAEQKRIMRLIPGLENAEFLRYGQIHRNTYINAPALLDRHAAAAHRTRTFFSRGRFRVSRATWSRSRRDWLRASRGGHVERRDRRVRSRARRRSVRLCHYITHADPRALSARQHCFRSLPAVGRSSSRDRQEGAPRRDCRRALEKLDEYWQCMSELETASRAYLGELRRHNDSPHTIRNYESRSA